MVEVVPIESTKKNIKRFVTFAWEVYRGNPYWVPPLIRDQVKFIREGVYLKTGVIQPFLALRGKKIVGRIIAHYDNRHNEYFGEKRGCVGFFECINDSAVSRALFAAAERWLAGQGMTEMFGPLSFLLYDASGLLLDDYEAVPAVELPYNPPYYVDLFADYGLEKVIDWYAYRISRTTKMPDLAYKLRDRLEQRGGFVFRALDLANYREEAARLNTIFNKAWEGNWGHMPLTAEQWTRVADELRPVVKPELVVVAERRGEAVGFILTVPDINQAIQSANGKLFPFGLIRMLLALRKVDRLRTLMMGVLPEYRMKGLPAVLILETVERGVRMGYQTSDCSLVVETNSALINVLDRFGAERYKTYRHFSKPIAGG